ncbi:hypothetical protein OKA05_13935 [Luteolibacter arcticus]|uniref:Uncharacterized protein n=1 Tax=Luteolibacter arcticus TaxID=1581411 RepID=A0ABT3GJK6_9BACT|nr:hypothetical protein [Luteolibacter arcticus]MCW1923661.1 hypothetical protein [Luteolibacter arcticus]
MDPPPIRPRRSVVLTAAGWLFIVTGTLLLPISVISLLMILARSYGTASADAIGFLSVVVAPPAALVTGIGLRCRRAWAWPVALLLAGFLVALNIRDLLDHRSTTETTVSPSGVRTTVLASPPNYHSLPLIAVGAALIAMLLRRPVRSELRVARAAAVSMTRPTSHDLKRDWRVGHRGRDGMYYEEEHGGNWQRIDIDGEMLMGPAHHVIYFASPAAWQRYPEWARHRREEIIARIKSEFRPPDYEYEDGGTVAATHPSPLKTTPQQWGALALVIAILLALAVGMGWLVKSGLERDATWFPAKRSSMQRAVARQAEPATYWMAISLYAAIGLGAGGFALWMLREGFRSRRQ